MPQIQANFQTPRRRSDGRTPVRFYLWVSLVRELQNHIIGVTRVWWESLDYPRAVIITENKGNEVNREFCKEFRLKRRTYQSKTVPVDRLNTVVWSSKYGVQIQVYGDNGNSPLYTENTWVESKLNVSQVFTKRQSNWHLNQRNAARTGN